MRSASSFNGQRIRASTFRSTGLVQDSSHRLMLVPNELPLPSLLQCMSPLLAQSGHSQTEFQCLLLGAKRTLSPSYTHLLCSVGRGVRKDQFRKLQKFCELSCGSADVGEF